MAGSFDKEQYLSLLITSNLITTTIDRRFPSMITILDLKGKLELLTGGNMDTMKTELRNKDGEFIVHLTGDSKTLADYGVENGMMIHVEDERADDEETNVSYELNEEEYAKRDESARAFLMRNKLGKYDENKIQKKEEEEAKESAIAETISVGSRCEVFTPGVPVRRGTIRHVGTVHFKPGDWIGVEYDEPVGKNDGEIQGKRYFESRPKYGGFVRPSNVKIGDFPEIGLSELDEI